MFEELLKVIRNLRQKCPWDRRQTISSSRPLLLNEVFELDEALRRNDKQAIQEELGDYLFIGLFLAHLLEEKKGIKLRNVVKGVVNKLKSRHPHIYGNLKVAGVDDVLKNWERIKGKRRVSILDGLPRALPALQQAQLIQERCRRVGFDWSEPKEVLKKVEEEIAELKREIENRKRRTRNRVKEELGDLLFALVNLCRHLDVDAEGALKDANLKFQRRFRQIEAEFRQEGKEISSVSLREMDERWERVKRIEI
ncbi:MAG: nucleoside triphosphate pyrophosphohydrolase [candidate division WOR-3 bacterium]